MANKQNAVQGNEKIVALLNRIMEYELAGVVRYTHSLERYPSALNRFWILESAEI